MAGRKTVWRKGETFYFPSLSLCLSYISLLFFLPPLFPLFRFYRISVSSLSPPSTSSFVSPPSSSSHFSNLSPLSLVSFLFLFSPLSPRLFLSTLPPSQLSVSLFPPILFLTPSLPLFLPFVPLSLLLSSPIFICSPVSLTFFTFFISPFQP